MNVAKLSDGRIGWVIREGKVAFAPGTHVLMSFPIEKDPFGHGAHKSIMTWVRSSQVAYQLTIRGIHEPTIATGVVHVAD